MTCQISEITVATNNTDDVPFSKGLPVSHVTEPLHEQICDKLNGMQPLLMMVHLCLTSQNVSCSCIEGNLRFANTLDCAITDVCV